MTGSRLQVVNVFSVGYSGSTWLNLLLGTHSQAFSVGEMKQLLVPELSKCMLHGEDCPVWSRFDLNSGENPFRQLERLTGKRVFIVNNSRKFLAAQREEGIESRFIHLIRDGRAVVASMLRKGVPSVWAASRMWAHEVRRDRRLMKRQNPRHVLTMRYEEVKGEMEGRLRQACGFLGLEFEPGMMEFWRGENHFLGGSKGTLYGLASMCRDREAAKRIESLDVGQKNWDVEYYREVDPRRFEDQRWKRELSAGQLRVFRWLAGSLNRRYGYPTGM